MRAKLVDLDLPGMRRVRDEIPPADSYVVHGGLILCQRRGRQLALVDWREGRTRWAADLPVTPEKRDGPRPDGEPLVQCSGCALLSKAGMAVGAHLGADGATVSALSAEDGRVLWRRELDLGTLVRPATDSGYAGAKRQVAAEDRERRAAPWNIVIGPCDAPGCAVVHVRSTLGSNIDPSTGELGAEEFLLGLDPKAGGALWRCDLPAGPGVGRAIITTDGASTVDLDRGVIISTVPQPRGTHLGTPSVHEGRIVVPVRTPREWGVAMASAASPGVFTHHMFPARKPRSVSGRLWPVGRREILLGDEGRNLAMLEADGRLRWTAVTPPYVYSVAALPDGPIAVATAGSGGGFSLLDRASGRVLLERKGWATMAAALDEPGVFLVSIRGQMGVMAPDGRYHDLKLRSQGTLRAAGGRRAVFADSSVRILEIG